MKGMLSNFGLCCVQKEKIITNFPVGKGDQRITVNLTILLRQYLKNKQTTCQLFLQTSCLSLKNKKPTKNTHKI